MLPEKANNGHIMKIPLTQTKLFLLLVKSLLLTLMHLFSRRDLEAVPKDSHVASKSVLFKVIFKLMQQPGESKKVCTFNEPLKSDYGIELKNLTWIPHLET